MVPQQNDTFPAFFPGCVADTSAFYLLPQWKLCLCYCIQE